jgi:hypothetical protein
MPPDEMEGIDILCGEDGVHVCKEAWQRPAVAVGRLLGTAKAALSKRMMR